MCGHIDVEMMPENDERQKLIKFIRQVLIVLTMITVTVTIISFLCIQSGNSNISVPIVPGNNTESAGGQTERYSGEVLVTTTTRVTVSEINVTDRPDEQIQDALFTNFQSLQTPEVTRASELKNDSSSELLQMIYKKSLNNDIIQNNRFDVMPAMHNKSTITVQPYSGTVFAGVNSTAINNNLYPTINHYISDNNSTISDNDEKYKLKEITHAQIHSAKSREVKHNKMVHNDKSMTVTNNIVTAKKGASTGQLNLYDLPNKIHDYSYIEDHISADQIGWKTIGRPENTKPTTSWTGGIDIWNQPSHGIGNHGYDELSLPNRIIKDHRKPIQQKENKIDWHKISIMALIKLALVKLQAIGFLKILFLILLKFKLYMIAVFVKFLLIMKLMKFSKMLILPLLILQLLPTLMQLLSMRSFNNMINLPGYTPQNQSGNLLSGVIQPVTTLPGGTTGTVLTGGTTGTGLSGGTTGTGLSGGTTGTGLPSVATGTGRPGITTRTIQVEEKKLSSFKVHDLNLISKQQNESSMMFDPTWEIFQKVLDSEKCIERIACQISVAEKAGVMPFWINWIIYHISTLIPSDKLETYLKTYKNVNTDIFNNSTSAENWTTWCLERYKCNSTNNVSNVMKNK